MDEFVKRLGELINGTQALVVDEICLIVIAIGLYILWKMHIPTIPSKEQLIEKEKLRYKTMFREMAINYITAKKITEKENKE